MPLTESGTDTTWPDKWQKNQEIFQLLSSKTWCKKWEFHQHSFSSPLLCLPLTHWWGTRRNSAANYMLYSARNRLWWLEGGNIWKIVIINREKYRKIVTLGLLRKSWGLASMLQSEFFLLHGSLNFTYPFEKLYSHQSNLHSLKWPPYWAWEVSWRERKMDLCARFDL